MSKVFGARFHSTEVKLGIFDYGDSPQDLLERVPKVSDWLNNVMGLIPTPSFHSDDDGILAVSHGCPLSHVEMLDTVSRVLSIDNAMNEDMDNTDGYEITPDLEDYEGEPHYDSDIAHMKRHSKGCPIYFKLNTYKEYRFELLLYP